MASHTDLGKQGEKLAKHYLEAGGFQVVNTNWKYSYYEIDIIAARNGVLHFIEVKTRRSQRFGPPEESVNKKKFKNLQNAGAEYQQHCPGWKRVQYDVLSITMIGAQTKFYFIEDVYL